MLRPLIAASLVVLATLPARADMRTWVIDPEHATVAFLVDHIGYAKVLGQFLETEGQFEFDPDEMSLGAVAVTVDAASVFSNEDRRDNHIRGRDFLAAKDNPQITFVANGGEVTSDTTGKVSGDLTIRGVTRPVALDVTLNKIGPYPFGHKKQTVGVSIRAKILRSEFGMTYALGGIVGDEVELLIEIEAMAED